VSSANMVVPDPDLIIDSSCAFKPGIYRLPDFGGIRITGSDITIDGDGAVLEGGTDRYPVPPTGEGLYTPGDRTLCPGTHRLESRLIDLRENHTRDLVFSYSRWQTNGGETAKFEVSRDKVIWAELYPRRLTGPDQAGWMGAELPLPVSSDKPFYVRVSIRVDRTCMDQAPIYDGFRISDPQGNVLWWGDACEHHLAWYNTGFSIWRREHAGNAWGSALVSENTCRVTLENFVIRNFHTGLHLRNVVGWHIHDNDFSDCYTDPDYGWGEGREEYAAIYMEEARECVVTQNTGSRAWNGLAMRRCRNNRISDNAFDHCANTAIKMTQSSGNQIRGNDLSWGLRIYPDEVHARDSVGVLIESGSDNNTFTDNDITHGGDGVFIRVLNDWCSVGNLFEDNDCSYANNNAFESWSPGNTYRRNKANWSSYGFWLGGSDNTLLEENEVLHNGKSFSNAPEPFGNAGVAVVKGSSSHFVLR
jgi:parallel beta-helix repeat protein